MIHLKNGGTRPESADWRRNPAKALACLEILDLDITLIALLRLIGGPQGEVVSEQLHDEGRILIRLFRQRVQLCNRVVERLLGQMTSSVGRVENLVKEHGEVKSQAQANRMCGRKVAVSDGGSRRVSLQSLSRRLFPGITTLELGKISFLKRDKKKSNRRVKNAKKKKKNEAAGGKK